ncbi:hypothetical protein [Mesorhizobium sp. M0323]|uniref:hypothetical protein n=1 Tax=Mesorhizobium sp. M0323 TaxID=2956938 RepID=UPI00333597EF
MSVPDERDAATFWRDAALSGQNLKVDETIDGLCELSLCPWQYGGFLCCVEGQCLLLLPVVLGWCNENFSHSEGAVWALFR